MSPESPLVHVTESLDKKQERLRNKTNKLKAFYALTRPNEPDRTSAATNGDSGHVGFVDSTVDVELEHIVIPANELEHLRARLRAQQKEKLSRPLLFQTSIPELLQVSNVRQLLLYSLVGGDAPGLKPQWCTLVRWQKLSQVIVIAIDGMTRDDWETYSAVSPSLRSSLDVVGRLVPQISGTFSQNLLEFPLSNRGKELSKRATNGNLDSNGPSLPQPPRHVVDTTHPLTFNPNGDTRVHHLMSLERMAMEKYPLPNFSTGLIDTKHYVPTKETYASVTPSSLLFAVDCEMCMTSTRRHELTRISIVDETLKVVYDTYVKPFNPISDYLTKYSGITKVILDPIETRLHDVQAAVRKILPPDAILCGQSLNGDLHALEMIHPYVIDTSVIFNLSGNPRAKSSLKILSQFFLGKSIQGPDKRGHDSVEDSRTTMELVLLKLRNGSSFGDVTRGWELILKTEYLSSDGHAEQPPALEGQLDSSPLVISNQIEQPVVSGKRKLDEMEVQSSRVQRKLGQKESVLSCCLNRGKKKAYVVGMSQYISSLAEKPSGAVIKHTSTAKRTIKHTLENLFNYEFIFSELQLNNDGDPEERKDQISVLMGKISKIFASANDKALCLLVLSGSTSAVDPHSRFGVCSATVKSSGTFVSPTTPDEGPAPDPD